MMNTKQEILDSLDGCLDGSPPPAIFTQTGTVGQMKACGRYWPEANFEIDALMELALQPSRMFGFATARIPYDITAEAERLGADIFPGDDGRQPMVRGSPYLTGEVLDPPDMMPVDEFLKEGRCAMYVEAAERMTSEHPDLFVTANMIGPMGVASHLVGMENMIMASFMAPDAVVKWTELMTGYQCEYAKALSEAADNVMMITGGAEDIMPAESFDDFVQPFEPRVFASMKESYSLAHCCGHTARVLEKLSGLGETMLSVETDGDSRRVVELVGDRVKVVGGINPIRTLLMGSPSDIRAAAISASDTGLAAITPECGVPPMTPDENLMALATYRWRTGF
jgi:[methyl-Co(III) methanol-specific corrinoid protein]:coenzyme M methyltransferase